MFLDMSHFSGAGVDRPNGEQTLRGEKSAGDLQRGLGDLQRGLGDLQIGLGEMNAGGDSSQRGEGSSTQVQRPHSPVAEFLDHLEFEPRERSQVILDKQEGALSDLESSRSSEGLGMSDKENISVGPRLVTDEFNLELQSSRSHFSVEQTDEETELDLRHEGIQFIPSPGIPIISMYQCLQS